MCVFNPLSMKSFHKVLAGNVHEYLLKSSIGKASVVSGGVGKGTVERNVWGKV